MKKIGIIYNFQKKKAMLEKDSFKSWLAKIALRARSCRFVGGLVGRLHGALHPKPCLQHAGYRGAQRTESPVVAASQVRSELRRDYGRAHRPDADKSGGNF